MTQAHCFIASFDNLGFECIIDATNHENKEIFAQIKGETHPRLPLSQIFLRAQANPQRNPEVWTFMSELDRASLWEYAQECPQEMADLIRENGSVLYSLPKTKSVIV